MTRRYFSSISNAVQNILPKFVVLDLNTMAKREYIEANRKWLEEKAKEEGVKILPRGIL